MSLCDIHILRLSEPEAWFKLCKNSLADTEFTIHVLAGVENEIGVSRLAGYSLGNCPFVACADADDVYVSSTINLLICHMHANPEIGIAYSGEFRWDATTNKTEHFYTAFNETKLLKMPTMVHGFTVFRRSAVEPFLHYLPAFNNKFEHWFLSVALVRAGWKVFGTPVIGRWWRQHVLQTSRKKNLNDKKIMMDFVLDNKFPEVLK